MKKLFQVASQFVTPPSFEIQDLRCQFGISNIGMRSQIVTALKNLFYFQHISRMSKITICDLEEKAA